MKGQLNLFSFPTSVKFFPAVFRTLHKYLWSLVREHDPLPGYHFRDFNLFQQDEEINRHCGVTVLYKERKVIGFCTLSYGIGESKPYIDVWVMPKYRGVGLGSVL